MARPLPTAARLAPNRTGASGRDEDECKAPPSPPAPRQFASYSAVSDDPAAPSPPPPAAPAVPGQLDTDAATTAQQPSPPLPWNLTSPLTRAEIEGHEHDHASAHKGAMVAGAFSTAAPSPSPSPEVGLEPRFGWRARELSSWSSFWCSYFARWVWFHAHPRHIRQRWTVAHSRALILTSYTAMGCLMFLLLFYYHGFASWVASPYGPPQEVTCHAVAWGNCGINGADCQPFESDVWQAVRCAPRCTLLNTEGTVLGGYNNIYRADSHLCMAALHAGVVESDTRGGCFLFRPAGVQPFYRSAGRRNGLTSQGFPSWFPGSITFSSVESAHCSGFGEWILLAMLLYFLPLCLLRCHPLLLWVSLIVLGYFYISQTLVDASTQRKLFWKAVGLNLWIAIIFGLVMYKIGPRYTLRVRQDQLLRAGEQWPWGVFKRLIRRLRGEHAVRDGSAKRQGRRLSTVTVAAAPVRSAQPSPRSSLRVQISSIVPSSAPGASAPAYSSVNADPDVNVPSGALESPLMPDGMASPSPSPSPFPPRMAREVDSDVLASPSASSDSQGYGGLSSPSYPPASPSILESPPATSVRYHPPQFPSASSAAAEGETVPAGVGSASLSQAPEQLRPVPAVPPASSGVWRTRWQSFVAALSPPVPAPAAGSHSKNSVPVVRAWFDLYIFYILPFFLAAHLSYIAYISPSADVDLNGAFFTHGDATGITVILVFVVSLLIILVYTVRLGFRANVLCKFLALYFLAGLVAMIVTLVWAGQATFHLHHVLVGMLLLPISRFPSRVSMVLQAVALGVFLNGLALWGMSEAWDVSAAPMPENLRVDPALNKPPDVVQLTNSTTDSVLIGWPVANPLGEAIGSSIVLNQVEIYHSTYEDSTYGGGGGAPIPALNGIIAHDTSGGAQERRMLRVEKAGKRRHHVHRDAAAAMEFSATALSPDTEELLRQIRSFHSFDGESLSLSFVGERDPAPLVAPSASSSSSSSRWRHIAPRPVLHERVLPPGKLSLRSLLLGAHKDASGEAGGDSAEADAAALFHVAALSSSEKSLHPHSDAALSPSASSLQDPIPPGVYSQFQLVNLLPNTSYLVTAGYINSGGDVSLGTSLVIRTRPRR